MGVESARDVRQIADQVEHLVAGGFVFETQLVVDQAVAVVDARVLIVGALPESKCAQHLDFFGHAERPGGSDLGGEQIAGQFDLDNLRPFERTAVIIQSVGDLQTIGIGQRDDRAFSISDRDSLGDIEEMAGNALVGDARRTQAIDEVFGRAIEAGQFDGVEFNHEIVQTQALARREQMFGRVDFDIEAVSSGQRQRRPPLALAQAIRM